MTDSLSRSLADASATVDRVAVERGYARATELVAPALANIPDGFVSIGAMDGWTAVVPGPKASIIPADWTGRILCDED